MRYLFGLVIFVAARLYIRSVFGPGFGFAPEFLALVVTLMAVKLYMRVDNWRRGLPPPDAPPNPLAGLRARARHSSQ